MRIFYDVKKRRLLIRLIIAIFSICSLIIVIKGYLIIPHTNPTLATDNPKQTPSAVSTQSSLPANTPSISPITFITPTVSISVDEKNQNLKTATFLPSPTLSSQAVTPAPSQNSISTSSTIKNTVVLTVKKQNTPTATLFATPKVTNKPSAISTKLPTPSPTEVIWPTAIKTIISSIYPKNPPATNTSNNDKSDELQIIYFNSNTTSSSNTINPMFKLINNAKDNINLSEIKIRYYYTADGNIHQNFWCDWCSAGTSNVYGHFVALKTAKINADQYLEIGFKNASGVIEPGKTTEIQTRFSKDNWTDYSQSNDYSFNPSKSYLHSNKITLYLNGNLIFGIEP